MDVYDEVDRRETDAGWFPELLKMKACSVCRLFFFFMPLFLYLHSCVMSLQNPLFFSLVGHTESQHSCHRHYSHTFSAC